MRHAQARGLCILGCLLGTISFGAQAAVIGSASNVVKDVSGKLQGAERKLTDGASIQADETVRTGAQSATQLNFLDNTSITIGAGSVVVLDKFVYNPDQTALNTVIRITKGTMRFVTGKSSPENFTLQTTSATIGIRGTDLTVVCESGDCSVAVSSGTVIVAPQITPGLTGRNIESAGANIVKLDQTTNFTTVSANGTTTGAQTVPPATITNLNNAVSTGQPTVTIAALNSQASGSAPAPAAQPSNQPAEVKTTEEQKLADSPPTAPFVLTPTTSGGSGGSSSSQ